MERNWQAVQALARRALLSDRGVDRILAEELTVPPGMDEIFSLLQLKRHHESGEFDVIVVDCAPTGETLRLLSFPEVARWWLEKVFPWEKRLVTAARPFARTMLDLPLPGNDVLAEVQRLVRNLIAMSEILRDREQRLDPPRDEPRADGDQGGAAHVHVPEPVRLPDRRGGREPGVPGRRRGRLLRRLARRCSSEQLELVEEAFAPVPVLQAPVLRAGGDRARRCSSGWATRCSAGASRRRCCTATSARSS